MKPLTVPKDLVNQVRKLDPTTYLNSQGFDVKNEGKHLSAKMNGSEIYRLTQKNEGHWLFTTKDGSKGGDNISLVTEIEGLKFKEAVSRLTDESFVQRNPQPSFQAHQKPKYGNPTLPFQSQEDSFNGRIYLSEERKISLSTIKEAEKQGLLKYTSDGVLFAGYDQDGKIRNLTKRMTKEPTPEILWMIEKGAEMPSFLKEVSKKPAVNSKNYSNQAEILKNTGIDSLQNIKSIITSKANDSERKPEIEHVFIIKENTQYRLLEQLKGLSGKNTKIESDKAILREKLTSDEFKSSIKDIPTLTVIGPSNKRDLSGSDKSYPQILKGSPKSVWIVEGGIDGLALRDMAIRSDKNPPTVIVSSGARVMSFLDNGSVQETLQKADNIVLAKEREKNSRIQSITDQDHQKQAEKIKTITGKKVTFYTPPEGIKDLADYNKKQVESLELARSQQKKNEIELSR